MGESELRELAQKVKRRVESARRTKNFLRLAQEAGVTDHSLACDCEKCEAFWRSLKH